jgi:glycerophosphoryl diester phosphodiesterase
MHMSRLVAHRGQKFNYPENTLESISEAISCGATAVEFDVQMTRDHVPVVCHDVSLLKTSGVDINITQVNYIEIKHINVNEPARFADKYQNVTLPSLQAMVAMLKNSPKVLVFVEIKNESIDVFGIDSIINQAIIELEPIKQHCVVIADNLQALVKLKRLMPVPTGWIIHRWKEEDLTLAEQNEINYLVINHKYCAGQVHDFAADNWQWVMYETSDPDRALALFEQGVAFVETNNICSMLTHIPANK